MTKPHRHKYIVPVMNIGGTVILGDQGICDCGAFRKPTKAEREKMGLPR